MTKFNKIIAQVLLVPVILITFTSTKTNACQYSSQGNTTPCCATKKTGAQGTIFFREGGSCFCQEIFKANIFSSARIEIETQKVKNKKCVGNSSLNVSDTGFKFTPDSTYNQFNSASKRSYVSDIKIYDFTASYLI